MSPWLLMAVLLLALLLLGRCQSCSSVREAFEAGKAFRAPTTVYMLHHGLRDPYPQADAAMRALLSEPNLAYVPIDVDSQPLPAALAEFQSIAAAAPLSLFVLYENRAYQFRGSFGVPNAVQQFLEGFRAPA